MTDRLKEGTTDVIDVTDTHRWIWESPRTAWRRFALCGPLRLCELCVFLPFLPRKDVNAEAAEAQRAAEFGRIRGVSEFAEQSMRRI